MKSYKAFIGFPESEDFDWYLFARDLPEMVFDDPILIKLLIKYNIQKEKLDEISIELKEEIEEELLYFGCIDKSNYNETRYIKSLIKIVSNSFKAFILKHILQTFEYPQEFFKSYFPFLEIDLININQ